MSAPARAPIPKDEIQRLAEQHRRGEISRREFFQKLAFASGSVLAAQEIFLREGYAREWEACEWLGLQGQAGQPTPKESITAGEKRAPASAQTEWVKYKNGDVEIGGYLARPRTGAPFAAIMVIHENRGLTEFVLDMAQRWAGEGLLALAPDCLSRLGGTAKYESMQAASQGIGQLQRSDTVADLLATLAYLKTQPDVKKNKIGVTGFCWGGGHTYDLTTETGELAFAAPFYGPPPALDKAENISCPIFATHAESDERINVALPAFEAKMKELGKPYTKTIYPGTAHAFMNFTGPRYNAEQAKAAWEAVTAFVKKVAG